MLSLRELLSPRARLLAQERRIRELEQTLEQLKAQNASMREGMRRCVTCEYRLDFKDRQSEAPVQITNKN